MLALLGNCQVDYVPYFCAHCHSTFVSQPGLLVYNLGQRQLRQALQQANQTLPNQLGKATQRPTLRWVFQCFMAVHYVVLNGIQQVVNLTDDRRHILQFFGSVCRGYYLLC